MLLGIQQGLAALLAAVRGAGSTHVEAAEQRQLRVDCHVAVLRLVFLGALVDALHKNVDVFV